MMTVWALYKTIGPECFIVVLKTRRTQPFYFMKSWLAWKKMHHTSHVVNSAMWNSNWALYRGWHNNLKMKMKILAFKAREWLRSRRQSSSRSEPSAWRTNSKLSNSFGHMMFRAVISKSHINHCQLSKRLKRNSIQLERIKEKITMTTLSWWLDLAEQSKREETKAYLENSRMRWEAISSRERKKKNLKMLLSKRNKHMKTNKFLKRKILVAQQPKKKTKLSKR